MVRFRIPRAWIKDKSRLSRVAASLVAVDEEDEEQRMLVSVVDGIVTGTP